MKAGRDYRAPLSKKAQAIIEGRPRFDKCAFVFTTNGKVAINGWGKTKQTLDQYMSEELGEPVADWRLHDCAAPALPAGESGVRPRSSSASGASPPAADVTHRSITSTSSTPSAAGHRGMGQHVASLTDPKPRRSPAPAEEGAEVPA
jgi:hypothetical protein